MSSRCHVFLGVSWRLGSVRDPVLVLVLITHLGSGAGGTSTGMGLIHNLGGSEDTGRHRQCPPDLSGSGNEDTGDTDSGQGLPGPS